MIIKTINHAIMITSFVFVMMLIIEYINIQTKGLWQTSLQKNRWKQYIVAALLGILPGCLGAFTSVALFSHGIFSFGAVVATMIATSGDEAFVMFAMIPKTAVLLHIFLFFISILAAWLTDYFFKKESGIKKFELHDEELCHCFPKGEIFRQLKNLTLQRGVLILLIGLLILTLISGNLGPQVWNWKRTTFLMINLISLFIVTTVPEHFLEKHLWEHVVKKHVPHIFMWTFGALLAMNLVTAHMDIKNFIADSPWMVLVIAGILGLIPESGPHLIFVTLYTQGVVSFPILLASSIVQDGHGMLPMLAESRTHFVKIKLINLAVGLLAGAAGILIMKI
ncbi:MAG: arsenic efflux protein [Candidatus Marinimicrobia bacterium]|nr:arsenic efflux protein [Candidatus Neomarinimicrobiota bacterium]